VVLRGHEEKVNTAAWSPDGTRIITASTDRTARVSRADGSGQPVVLGGASVRATHAYWSPDGASIVTQSDDGMARLWRDALPLSGPDDDRLWRASSYCLSIPLRIDLLQVTEAEARRDLEACERRVERSHAQGAPSGAPSHDTVRP